MNRISKSGFVVIAFALSFTLLLSVAKADELYARIQGVVTDQSGAVVPGATITATNTATGVAKQVTSGADGTFSFLELSIGDYQVKAEKSGFQAYTTSSIHLDVNQVYSLPVTMTVGAVNQTVTVEANPIQVETTTPQLGTVITADQIVTLPLLGRDWINLQALQPGVVGASDRFGTSGPPAYATNGGESQFNVFLIDGTDTNDMDLNTATFIPSEDAISEFRMVTSTLNPEYARSSGAIMNAAIKSGTNSFHGDLFEYYRDTFLDSRNYFAPSVSPFHENQFGGTIGGPIIKKHTFGFFSYEGVRENAPQDNNGVINGVESTLVFQSGQAAGTTPFAGLSTSANTSPFSLVGDNGTTYPAGTPYSTIFSAGTIPTADISAVSKNLLKYIPAPISASAAGGPLDTFVFNATRAYADNQYIYRIDQDFNAKDSLWGTWFNEKIATTEPVPFQGGTLPGFGEVDQQFSKFLTLSWSHVINDHMINELRGGYNRFNYEAVFPQTPQLPSSVGFSINPQSAAGAGLPYVSVQGLFTLGFSEFGPQPRKEQIYQASDNFTWLLGAHTLKFGFDMRRWEDYNPSLSTNSGAFFFQPFGAYSTGVPGADFLLGLPAYYEQASGGLENARTREYYSYAQDEFKFQPNLTLMYGLGWTVDTPILNIAYNGHGQMAFRPGQQSTVFPNAPIGVVYQGDAGVDAAGPTQWKNVGPRIGIAYSPNWGNRITGGPGKMSIRAGYGIYYDKSEIEQAGQVGFGVPPFAISTLNGIVGPGKPLSGINPGFAKPFVDVATGTAVSNPYPFSGYPSSVNFATTPGLEPIYTPCCATVAPNTHDPRVSNYNLTVERQINETTIASVGYVGSESRLLSYGMPLNIVTGLSGTTPVNSYNLGIYGPIDEIFSGGNGNYNAFEASVNKKMSHDLQFLISYTYGHAFDDTSGFENSSFGEYGGETGGFGGSIRSANPYCFPRCDYASSVFDARQRLVISYVYQLPGMNGSWWLSRMTQGWSVTGITTFQTGFPVDIADLSDPSGGCDGAADFTCWDGPNQTAPVKYLNPRKTGMWFDPSSFPEVSCAAVKGGCPAARVSPTSVAAYGNAPRNPVRGPGINNWDFVLFKDTAISEKMKIQLRMEAYNIFNHTQFDPNGIVTNASSSAFGSILAAQNPRLMQIAAKFIF